jgi:dCTP deaminase
MILNDEDLWELVRLGYLPEDVTIGPSSVDLTLDGVFLRPKPQKYGPSSLYYTQRMTESLHYQRIEKDRYLLKPAEFVLATTKEKVRIPNYLAASVAGRSSVGRLGVQVQNAGFIDAGFEGQITLELHNQTFYSIELMAGVRICQLVFYKMTNESRNPYRGKYLHQSGPTGSRLYLETNAD